MPNIIADKIILNANIKTMDADTPFATAVAIKNGCIVFVGSDEDARAMADLGTDIIDAKGNMVLPGFQDTHIHIHDTGTDISQSANLYACKTVADIQAALAEFVAENPDCTNVRGLGFDCATFPADMINRSHIDEVISDRPVFLLANDYHNSVINSFACEEFGLIKGTPDPDNGHFVLDDDGEPTGYLYEDAWFWAVAKLPKYTDEDVSNGLLYGAAHANEHGITGVLDAMISKRHLRLSKVLEDEGRLNVRIRSTFKIKPTDSDVEAAVENLKDLREKYKSDMLSLHSAKFFLDGVFENKTAALLEPDSEGDNAPLMFDEDHLKNLIVAFDKEKFQCHLHTIGDKAVRFGLDCIEAARDANGSWDALHQFAHLQLIDPADIPRFAELKVVANYQPLWAVPDGKLEKLLGPERSKTVYPVNGVIKTGAPYAISSDWGVSTLNPFEIMQVATTRQNPEDGPDGQAFYPEHCITVDEVVRGYTVNAAAGAWRLDKTGSITVGKYADIIMIDQDVYTVSKHALGNTKVLLTLLEGREVYRA